MEEQEEVGEEQEVMEKVFWLGASKVPSRLIGLWRKPLIG